MKSKIPENSKTNKTYDKCQKNIKEKNNSEIKVFHFIKKKNQLFFKENRQNHPNSIYISESQVFLLILMIFPMGIIYTLWRVTFVCTNILYTIHCFKSKNN